MHGSKTIILFNNLVSAGKASERRPRLAITMTIMIKIRLRIRTVLQNALVMEYLGNAKNY